MHSILRSTTQGASKASAQRGFTLIELMFVVAIIGMLAPVAIPAYGKYVLRAKVTEALVLMSGRKPNIAAFYSDHGVLPLSFMDIGWPSASSKKGQRDRSDFEDVFGYESDIWKAVELQRKKTGKARTASPIW